MEAQTRYRQVRGASAAAVTAAIRRRPMWRATFFAVAAMPSMRRSPRPPHSLWCGRICAASGLTGFILVYDAKTRKVHAINAAGPAPAAANAKMFANGFPDRGPLLSSVPGIVDGWGEAHSKFGRLKWAT